MNDFLPSTCLYRTGKLSPHFLIRYKYLLLIHIICKISQMYQQCQCIIFTVNFALYLIRGLHSGSYSIYLHRSQNSKILQKHHFLDLNKCPSSTIPFNFLSMEYCWTWNHFGIKNRPFSRESLTDIVYLPRRSHMNKPAIIVELKWDKSADCAIEQIKNRNYHRR